ncbi:MAG: hypothetical protein GY803_30870 [Chloroflexi bacterium]|nr:hypothetical protein [Chloroflexota bacterium]
MAALSLHGRTDTDHFIETFSGSHRFVLDYLTDEVLARLDPDLRQFLYQTAFLRRLHADLCRAVTGRDDAAELLTRLEETNLFVVPLDDERRWYRYHQLFADLLQIRQQKWDATAIPVLHKRPHRHGSGKWRHNARRVRIRMAQPNNPASLCRNRLPTSYARH